MKTASPGYVVREQLDVRDVELPAVGPRDALVQVDLSGLCTWGLFIFSGGFQEKKPYPFYFGHEGVGTFLEVGPKVNRVRVGDRVALRETRDLGRAGHGQMAATAVLPEHMLIPLPCGACPRRAGRSNRAGSTPTVSSLTGGHPARHRGSSRGGSRRRMDTSRG